LCAAGGGADVESSVWGDAAALFSAMMCALLWTVYSVPISVSGAVRVAAQGTSSFLSRQTSQQATSRRYMRQHVLCKGTDGPTVQYTQQLPYRRYGVYSTALRLMCPDDRRVAMR
jgi:hypothetical protein